MYLNPGALLQGGKYKIVRTLGQGGFGITYEAVQVALDRKVAVKEFFMKEGAGGELAAKFQAKFIKEARVLANLEHPHIIRVTDVFEETGTAFYVMDFLPGGSLSDRVRKKGRLSPEEAEKYIRQVASALKYIHDRNLVHLDVKPANILLNAKEEAVLIDFGISKHYDSAGGQTSSTPIGMSKGYAPLEQAMDGDVSQFKPSTDIYALGATFYHLLTGSPPPEASIVNEDGLDRPKLIPSRLWNAVSRAMQPKRKDRPQSIPEFLALMDETEDNEGTVIFTPQAVPEKKVRKGLLAGIVGGVAVAAIIAGLLFVSGKKPAEEVAVLHRADTVKAQQEVLSDSPSNEELSSPVKKTASLKKEEPLVREKEVKEQEEKAAEVQSERNETVLAAQETVVEDNPTRGSLGGHEWVDMGLSVKWASCNLGAAAPSDPGDYFAWGELVSKHEFKKDNYTFHSSGMRLGTADDAASQAWGQGWRIPTSAEQAELMEKCIWTWTTQKGVNGYEVTSRTTGNSLFLPATGQYSGSMLVFESDFGYYWSSVSNNAKTAVNLYFSSGQIQQGAEIRESGSPIRAVF